MIDVRDPQDRIADALYRLCEIYDAHVGAQLKIADALSRIADGALVSVNELDANMDPANVVDGLFAIARALDPREHR